jgi:hypothetical protein
VASRTAGLDGERMVIYVPKAVKFGVMAASMTSFLRSAPKNGSAKDDEDDFQSVRMRHYL